MHHLISALLRQFNLTLHETTSKNVRMARDNFIGQTEPGLNDVQVRVLEEYFQ
jgi:hypothetical protein